ncbi:MAG: hypothetical protein LUE87_06755 [Lachnospiraceae bacterium]|nr:hypothetical protein [Lachnospiraceae bacterium]
MSLTWGTLYGVEIDGEDEGTIVANVRRVDVSAEEIRIIFKDEEDAVAV